MESKQGREKIWLPYHGFRGQEPTQFFSWLLHFRMVSSCAAIGCANRDIQQNRARGIKFYRIPLKEERKCDMKRNDQSPGPDCTAMYTMH
jgi:hypothetical protein